MRLCGYLFKYGFIEALEICHSYPTRFRSNLLPAFRRLTNSRKSIMTAGANVWNELPNEVKLSRSEGILNNRVKRYFISKYE